MSLEIVKKTPSIFWFQNRENVILDIHIQNLNKNIIIIKENHFSINNDSYTMQFSFFDNINNDEIEYKETENYLRIIVKKENEDNFWKYLSKNNIYKNNIKVNWDNWRDEDDDEENEMGMEGMMPGMEGMMPGMEGMMPGMEGMMPGMEGMMPGMEGMMPGMEGMMPGMEGMEGMMPGMEGMEDLESNEDDSEVPDLESNEDDSEVPDLESTEDNNE